VAQVHLCQRASGPASSLERHFATDLATVELVAGAELIVEAVLNTGRNLGTVDAQLQFVGDVEMAITTDQFQAMEAALAQPSAAVDFRCDDVERRANGRVTSYCRSA